MPGALAVRTELAAAEGATPALPEALPGFAACLENQAPRLPDCAARRAAGQPGGSGAIEEGADLVVNRRGKGKRGMRWVRARANGVLAWRVAELNDAWGERPPHALARPPQHYRPEDASWFRRGRTIATGRSSSR